MVEKWEWLCSNNVISTFFDNGCLIVFVVFLTIRVSKCPGPPELEGGLYCLRELFGECVQSELKFAGSGKS
jgi:hypothetical protein